MRKTLLLLFAVTLAACKTPGSGSAQLLNTPPSANGQVIEQGPMVRNKCNAGGHDGATQGDGWLFSPKEGCYLDCRDEAAAKADFLSQLKAHRVMGDPNVVGAVDPNGAAMLRRFREAQAARGVQLNTFENLTTEKLFNGSNWKTLGIRPGDIFINMNFGQPNHAGIFYSKRGLAHARMVVEVNDNEILTFDGGWQAFSRLKQVNAQTVWLRPRAEFIRQGDMGRIVKWAKMMEDVPYDNTLVDDWKEFRVVLHKLLDEGKDQLTARNGAFAWAKQNGKAPGSLQDSLQFKPPSGLYCSEGTAGIYSYVGFRQFGETALDMITTWGENGDLPDWTLYSDALSGFGADSDPKIYMMHQLFYNYFKAFDQGRKAGVIKVPGVENAQGMTFAAAVEANFKAIEADGGASNHVQKQLDDFQAALTQGGQQQQLQGIQELKAGLQQAVASLSERAGQEMNLSQAVYTLFYANKAYGPHTFFENGKYFEFQGVFYNTDFQNGGQALFIADWWRQTVGQPKQSANIQTTLFRIKNNPQLPADKCVIAEKAPVLKTN